MIYIVYTCQIVTTPLNMTSPYFLRKEPRTLEKSRHPTYKHINTTSKVTNNIDSNKDNTHSPETSDIDYEHETEIHMDNLSILEQGDETTNLGMIKKQTTSTPIETNNLDPIQLILEKMAQSDMNRQNEMAQLNQNIHQKMTEIELNRKKDMTELKQNITIVNQNMIKLKEEVNKEITGLRTQIQTVENKLDQKYEEMNRKWNGELTQCKIQMEGTITQKIQSSQQSCQAHAETLVQNLAENINSTIDIMDKENGNKFNTCQNTLKTHECEIKEQKKEVYELKNNLNEIESKIREGTNHKIVEKVSEVIVSCNGNVHVDNMPKFDGKNRNPTEFIKKFDEYFEQTSKRRTNLDENNYLELMEYALEGLANKWWQITKETVNNREEFKRQFYDHYWSQEIQRNTRRRIEDDWYREGGRLTRSEYFLDRVLLLRNITPPLDEYSIVNIICNNFEDRIQDAARIQNIRTVPEFLNLLVREELLDQNRKNKNKPQYRHDNQNRDRREEYQRNYQVYQEERTRNYQAKPYEYQHRKYIPGTETKYDRNQNNYNNRRYQNETSNNSHNPNIQERNNRNNNIKINHYQHTGRIPPCSYNPEENPTREQSNTCQEIVYPRREFTTRPRLRNTTHDISYDDCDQTTNVEPLNSQRSGTA